MPFDCHATPTGRPRTTGFGRAEMVTVGGGGGGDDRGVCDVPPPPKRFEKNDEKELPMLNPPRPLVIPDPLGPYPAE